MRIILPTLFSPKKEFDMFLSLQTNTIIRWCSRIALLFTLGSLVFLFISWNKLPNQVPLWYSKPWGEDRLVSPSWLYLLPGASICWYIINTALSMHVTKDHLVFSQILFLSSLVVSIFSFVTLFMIIWIIS